MELTIQLFDLVLAFSRMLDRVMPELAGHNTRVGFFTGKAGKALGLPPETQQRVVIAGLMHDVGALPLRVTADDLIFERNKVGHSLAGERLVNSCPPLCSLGTSIRHHHTPWYRLDSSNPDHRLAALINLADRVDVFVKMQKNSFCFKDLRDHLCAGSGKIFCSDHVEAMLSVLNDPKLQARIIRSSRFLAPDRVETLAPVTTSDARQFSRFMGHVIDYRSPFTATHSAGVAETVCSLAEYIGLEAEVLDTLYIAGMLHDIGKLDVPLHILEKPGPLTREEAAVMSGHASLSEQWLNAVPGFEKVSQWGALHHERMNGSGYPHGYKGHELELPSRLMAVADVFTAITEDRPYRLGMPLERAVGVLQTMAACHLDHDLVAITVSHANDIDSTRKQAQNEAQSLYADCRDVSEEQDPNDDEDDSTRLFAKNT